MSKQNTIELISVVLGAGESRIFALSGEYFEVIDAPNPIDVVLSDFNGSQRARMNQASAAFYSKGVEYGVIQITSATAQTIRFAYGSGETGTRRATGSVTISGPVALDAATLLALEQTNNRPEAPTASYATSGAVAANTPLTIFAPGANVNGAIILNAHIAWQDAGVTHSAVFLSKSGAPPTTVTGGSIILAANSGQYYSASLTFGQAWLPITQFIPAGEGLYFIDGQAQPSLIQNMRSCRYRLL
jgi:hypothetical protein